MAATLTQERFTAPEWIFERKFDGIRLLAFKNGAEVRLFSRNRLLQNMPSVAAAIAKLSVHDLILDGEVTWGRAKSAYHVFDIMWLEGRSLTSQPLEARQKLLSQIRLRAPLHRVTALKEPLPWELAQKEGWEGVIAKRRDSVYEHRRSRNWLKMKCELTEVLAVGGFTEPQGRRVGLGALLVGYFEGKDFVFAGKIGTGFDNKMLLELRKQLDTLEIDEAPFNKAIGLPRLRVHWVRPKIVVRVGFIEWTGHDKLRHPRLLAILHDKAPRDAVRRQS